mgnify:CR=1 FL=1|jgi:uncharacterized protein YqfA (UPF0365 family)|tara:strand:- start:4 stop:234 length:231 start_codon:yes stop_codon:yes gene_type:complete
MKDTVTYPLSAIMDEDEESPAEQLERELVAAVAKERERCARVCEGRAGPNSMGAYEILMAAAEAIRKGEIKDGNAD